MSPHSQRRRVRGLTIIEVIVAVIALVILAVIVMLALPTHRCGGGSASLKDKAQQKQIHQSMLVFANENNERLPLPSLVVESYHSGADAAEEVGEDYALNHTANIYSMLVVAEYFNPDILIGPTEVSPIIEELLDYNYSVYDPDAGTFWDETLVMHIHDPAVGANGSFALLAMVGDRREHWASTAGDFMPIMGTRGTEGGALSGAAYDDSPTLRLHGRKDEWIGNVVYGDNHTEVISTFTPEGVRFTDSDGTRHADNIFAAEFDHEHGSHAAMDTFLSIFISADQWTVQDVYDPLE